MSPMAIEKLINRAENEEKLEPLCVENPNQLLLEGSDENLKQTWLEIRVLRCGSQEFLGQSL